MSQPPNLDSLANSGQPLLVHCLTCGHRSAVAPEKVGARQGSMEELRSLKLKSSLCQHKNFEFFVVHTSQAVAHLLAGAAIETYRKWREGR